MSTISKTLSLLSQTDGRDKIYKVGQYGSRLIWWILINKGRFHSPSNAVTSAPQVVVPLPLASRFAQIDSSLSDARRVFRLGGFIRGFVSTFREALSTDNKKFLHSFKFLSVLSNFIMESMDVVIWGAKIRVINTNKRRWDWWHNVLWMVSILYIFVEQINILQHTLAQRRHLLQQKKAVVHSNDIQVASKERKVQLNKDIAGIHEKISNIIYTFIRYGCDFYMCAALLRDKEHRGIFGLLGVISGVLGLMQSWKKL